MMRFIRSLTLKEICLQVIIDNLHEYIYNRVRGVQQRHIDFLLRLYSEQCFREYTNSHSKTEECLLWFLNSYNKTVFLSGITQNIIEKLQIVGPVITSLTLRETMAKESTLNAVIILVPHLSYLDLSSTSCSDKTLLCIQKMCPNLITLNLQECGNVTNDGMLKLCSGSNLSLKNLNILYTLVEYSGLNYVLNGMPSLECLTYENIADSFYCIREHSVEHCIQKNIKYNLTELIYEDIGLAQNPQKVIWTWTVLCPNVTKVHILFAVDHNILELCSRFPHLTELKLEMEIDFFYIVIPDPLAAFLPIANNLSTLILSHVKIPSVTLIECFKNVKNLYLKRVCFTTFSKEEIKSKYTNLDTLSIKSVNLSETSTYNFISLLISLSKNVTKLILSNMDYLPDELVDIIINSMKSLTFVEFCFIHTKLSSFFCRFFEIPSVQQVYLDECITSFSGPAHVAHKSNTLSWCIMNTLCDDDDDDDGGD